MSTFVCPGCGKVLKVIPLSGPGGGWQRGQAFPMGAAPPGSEFYRETPAGKVDTVESGVKVPLLQSAITGAVTGVVSVIPTVYYHWPWTIPLVLAVGTFGFTWWLLLQDTRRLLRRVETFIGADLDRGGHVGDPQFTVEVTDLSNGKKRMSYCHFPARREQVLSFAVAALNDQLTVYGGHKLSRRVFSKLRDEAVARGLISWVDPGAHTQGVGLTKVGQHVFERLLLEGIE